MWKNSEKHRVREKVKRRLWSLAIGMKYNEAGATGRRGRKRIDWWDEVPTAPRFGFHDTWDSTQGSDDRYERFNCGRLNVEDEGRWGVH